MTAGGPLSKKKIVKQNIHNVDLNNWSEPEILAVSQSGHNSSMFGKNSAQYTGRGLKM